MKPINRGQALTEFAIFGSLLLFCVAMLVQYGLEANYQQQVQMEAFRKAQRLAFYRDSGPNAAASLLLVKDKPLPDPRDQFGFAERNPVAAGESVVWNTSLSSQYVKEFNEQPKEKDLPAMYFEIDGVSQQTGVVQHNANGVSHKALIENVAKAYVPPKAEQPNVFGFYTARFEKRPCPEEITVVLEDPAHNDPRNTKHTEYFSVPVRREEIWVARIEGSGFGEGEIKTKTGSALMYPYFRDKRKSPQLKRRITDADVDGDGQLEYVIGADKNKNLFYIDSHDTSPASSTTLANGGQIQIDTAYAQVEPGDKDVITGQELKPEQRQGMIQDFAKTIKHTESKIEKMEKDGTIVSLTSLNAKQTITHKFRLNNGQVVSIPVEFSTDPNKVLYDWSKK